MHVVDEEDSVNTPNIFFLKSTCVSPYIFVSKTFVSVALPYHYHILLWENFQGIELKIHKKKKDFTHPGWCTKYRDSGLIFVKHLVC